jgi:RHS repeat-associated protein
MEEIAGGLRAAGGACCRHWVHWVATTLFATHFFCLSPASAEELVLESCTFPVRNAAGWSAKPPWRAGTARASCVTKGVHPHVTAACYRFGYETEPSKTYTLTEIFTVWTNGVFCSTVVCSNLVSGDGTTRWQTNEIFPQVQAGKVIFTSEGRLLTPALGRHTTIGVTRVLLDEYLGTCGACGTQSGPQPGQPGPISGTAGLRLSLGRTIGGQPVGELNFLAHIPDAKICRPEGLNLLALKNAVAVIRAPDSGALRQVGSPQCLVDITPTGDHGYQVAFYPANALLARRSTDGLISTNGLVPFVVWCIANPAFDGNPNTFHVIECRDATRTTNAFSWNGTGWECLLGNGLRKEILTSSWDSRRIFHTETRQILAPSDGRLVWETAAIYRRFDWGEGIIQEILGAGADRQTNHYAYWNRPGTPSHGRLQQRVSLDGNWERFEYDKRGRISRIYRPFANRSPAEFRQARALWLEYSPWMQLGDDGSVYSLRPRTVTERVGPIMVGRRYFIPSTHGTIEVECTSASRVPFDSPALCLTNWFASPPGTSPADPALGSAPEGRLARVDRPDGTLEIFSNRMGPGVLTNIIVTGAPDASRAGVLDGFRSVTVTGGSGELLLREIFDLAPGRTDVLIHREAYWYLDPTLRSYVVTYLDGTSNVVRSGCCGIESYRNRDGLITVYAFDALKRLTSEAQVVDGTQSIFMFYTYDAADHRVSTVRVGTDGTNSLLQQASDFDTAGRLRSETNALGGVTRWTYGADRQGRYEVMAVLPDSATRVERYNRDGSTHDVSGTGVHGLGYDYSLTAAGTLVTRETKLTGLGQPTPEWVAEFNDWHGRLIKTEYADGAHIERTFNDKGQLSRECDADGVVTLYGYDRRNVRSLVAVRTDWSNRCDGIDFTGTDRITSIVRDIVLNSALGTHVQRTRLYCWDEPNVNRSNLVSTLETSVDGLRAWRTRWSDGQGVTNSAETVFVDPVHRLRVDRGPGGECSVRSFRYGRLATLEFRDASGAVIKKTQYSYDSHNRPSVVSDSGRRLIRLDYNAADLVIGVTTEGAGQDQPRLATRTFYDERFQAISTLWSDGTQSFTEYHPTGEIKRRWGSRVYPTAYTCDYAGRVKTSSTWQRTNDPSSKTSIAWNYNPRRGWLDSKRYADGLGPNYEHTPSGRVSKRTWARETCPGSGVRLSTSYQYSPAGDLAAVTYNDGVTPNLSYAYDRRGRLTAVTHGNSKTSLAYNNADQCLREVGTAGLLGGITVSNSYDQFLRLYAHSVASSRFQFGARYTYDPASRLQSVSTRELEAKYDYRPGSVPPERLTFSRDQRVPLVTIRSYDASERLSWISSVPMHAPALTYEYLYDQANQPARALLADCTEWTYTYDDLGQLERVRMTGPDAAKDSAEYDYKHDQTGNRLFARTVRGVPGIAENFVVYGANELQQYISKASRGCIEQLQYDPDGNLTNNGRWTLIWDAENRLTGLVANAPDTTPARIQFAYDDQGRRIAKKVWSPTGAAPTPTTDLRFVYHGWNLVGILDSQSVPIQSFTWGLDCRGAWNRAGAAGALLVITQHQPTNSPTDENRSQKTATQAEPSPATQIPVFDGDGNVVALVESSSGLVTHGYRYGPFGEPIDGQGAALAVFGYSTQYRDVETGFLYYGHRYYDPELGRWISRDPLNELAFRQFPTRDLEKSDVLFDLNVFAPQDYLFLDNAPTHSFDLLGLASACDNQVRAGLQSRRNRKILQKIAAAGCATPKIHGADAQGYCSIPGFLGDYDCPSKEGKICCLNLTVQAEPERVAHHELVHALDCCRNGMSTCEEQVCSEIVAYYLADCQWFANRMQCALTQMRASLSSNRKCAHAAALASAQTAHECLKRWKSELRATGRPLQTPGPIFSDLPP